MADREDVESGTPSDGFAAELSRQLNAHLRERDWNEVDAARMTGQTKQRINLYCLDQRMPNAEMLVLLCVKLGFALKYNGYRIVAKRISGKSRTDEPSKQAKFEFDRQFNLTEDNGTVAVKVRRPPGRIRLSLSMKADAS